MIYKEGLDCTDSSLFSELIRKLPYRGLRHGFDTE